MLLVLGKPISGWCPQTSKLGGLSNHVHEPRKLVPLGTMTKSAAECESDVIAHDDVALNPEQQLRKNFSKEKN